MTMKRLTNIKGPDRAGRMALRFFAAMIVLTLISRGMAGAAMARVKTQKASHGTIQQRASVAASLSAEEGETLELPAGILVDTVWCVKGQTVQQGEPILRLNLQELEDAQEMGKIQLAQQQARLAQLTNHTPLDASAVAAAQQSLAQSEEDASREQTRAAEEVQRAEQQQQTAQKTYEEAVAAKNALEQQIDPRPTGEELAQADSAVKAAQAACAGAEDALRQAKTAQEDAALTAQRRTDSAHQALVQANAQWEQAQKQDALAQQSSQADAAGVQREIRKISERNQQIEALLAVDGLVYAPRTAQVTRCDLQEGQPSPERSPLVLAKEGSVLLARFELPEQDAEKLPIGQKVMLNQEEKSVTAQVQTISPANEKQQCQIIAAVQPEEAARLKVEEAAQAELIFSNTKYPSCIPVSALRQDAEGDFVLTVEQTKTAFGVTNTAIRVPVTVLEINSEGSFAAVSSGSLEQVIVEADRAVQPGASVRVIS